MRKTFTVLPDWLAPSGHYSLHCRQQSCEAISAGNSAEQAAPHCKDPSARPIHPLAPMGTRRLLSIWCWLKAGAKASGFYGHPPSLPGIWAQSAVFCRRGKKSVNRQALDELKQQIPLLGYLQAHDWHPARPLSRGRWMGLCPLHEDHKPSFLVDPNKDLFYCYGCGRGGDVIRFAELYHEVKFPQALALLHQWRGLTPILRATADFYRMQLHRHGEAIAYLHERGVRTPELIEHMQIGYAPGGGCLRRWLTQLGYPFLLCVKPGWSLPLATTHTHIASSFRWRQPLWPQSLGFGAASPLPARYQGSLYGWEQVRQYADVILVEGLFDYAVLWQAGFHNVTCSMGNHLNAPVPATLRRSPNRLLTFDADANGSGQQAAQCLSRRLRQQHITAHLVSLPEGHDRTASLSPVATLMSFGACWRTHAAAIPCRSTTLH